MDDARLAGIEQDLRGWGVLEPQGEVRLTTRFRGALARAALALGEREKEGRAPPGHPVENLVAEALAGWDLPEGAVVGTDHRAFVVAVEVASLPEAVRRALGI